MLKRRRDFDGKTGTRESPVPRYYFHIHHRSRLILDWNGEEHADLRSALDAASLLARDFRSAARVDGAWSWVEVRDDKGASQATIRCLQGSSADAPQAHGEMSPADRQEAPIPAASV